MKNIKLWLFSLMILVLHISCEDYVTDLEKPLDVVEDETLNSQENIPIYLIGLDNLFARNLDNTLLFADGLSDQLFFTNDVKGATFTEYDIINSGNITLDNISLIGAELGLGEFRKAADDLLDRTNNKITFTDQELKREALFKGYFYGAIARYMYATYFGLDKTTGGGVIELGAFIPATQMYADALDRFQSAIDNTDDAYMKRVINSLIARLHLYNKAYPAAATAIANGLQSGDAPLTMKFSTIFPERNLYYDAAGLNRNQFVLDQRFRDYLALDSNEVNRLPQYEAVSLTDERFFAQARYDAADSPIPFISYEETQLMLAELIVRGNATGDAVAIINAIRTNYQIDPLVEVNIGVIETERDKTLFVTGARLPDQRRFGSWHLPAGWQYLPITDRERNENPNF